ncbi:MAG: aldehyde:ferredoxin oxidoreductase, partial [Caldilineae bacterium]
MPHGYNGKILHVNLTTGEMSVEEPPESFYRKYMGGSAMGLYYVLKGTPPRTDPLGPDNVLALTLGVTTGAPISGQSRMTATAKSPLTGAIGDSQCGGFWPAELKFAGFDGIILTGKSPRPVYLWIHNGQAELREAGHLWGKITGEVEAALKAELDDDRLQVLQVGPAGERGVRFAAIMNMSNRANGRTGMGAVMGSKNLKAIAVRGTQKPSLADRDGLNELARWGAATLPESFIAGLAKYGTAETCGANNAVGGLPTRNWQSGYFEEADAIDGPTMYDTVLRGVAEGKQDRYGRDTCYGCTVRCKRVVEITDGPYKVDPHYGGPEYETLATLGSYCGVSDLAAVSYANQLCNQYGMDTISCGATIAWAMECFENGLLTLEETGGVALRFGNAEALVRMTEMIGRGEGFGAVLGMGSAAAAAHLGRGEAFLAVAKKQEVPAHMPQVKRSLGLIYAVNPFGADHESSEHDPAYEGGFKYYKDRLAALGLTEQQPKYSLTEEKVRFALKTQHLYSMLDSVNLCQFVFGPAWQLYGPEQTRQAIQAITGWDVTIEELQTVGERRVNMMRVFNAREGLDRRHDTLSERFFTKALKGGRSDGMKLDREEFERGLDNYYRLAGW